MSDRAILNTTAFLRALTTGFVGVTLGLYLARAGFAAGTIGMIVSAGLAGAALAALLATAFADRLGRRRFLAGTALIGALGTLAFVLSCESAGARHHRLRRHAQRHGPRPRRRADPRAGGTAGHDHRRRPHARLRRLHDAAGHRPRARRPARRAAGGTASGEATGTGGYRVALFLCAGLGLATGLLYLRLRAGVEPGAAAARHPLSPRSRRLLLRLSALFGIDSLAGGFLTTSLLSYFFFARFGAAELAIGALFFAARLMNAASHLAAAWLAARIGLVNTMVFTHIPSSVLLMTVAFAPSFPVAAALFLLREGLVEMDVPTRSSYVLAVVEPGERTLASGVTNLVRLAGWAAAPVLAGSLMGPGSLYLPLVIGAGMKIAYDLLLWTAFRGIKPPEER